MAPVPRGKNRTSQHVLLCAQLRFYYRKSLPALLKQDDILPTQLGEVIGHRGARDASPADDHPGLCRQGDRLRFGRPGGAPAAGRAPPLGISPTPPHVGQQPQEHPGRSVPAPPRADTASCGEEGTRITAHLGAGTRGRGKPRAKDRRVGVCRPQRGRGGRGGSGEAARRPF